MLITQAEFDQKLENKSLKLCFVGMSNIGKSHATQLLCEAFDFSQFEVDEAINQALETENLSDTSDWLGYPFDERNPKNVAHYLRIEKEKTNSPEIQDDQSFILDTTGSVIYLDEETLETLSENYLIVHFQATDSMLDHMVEDYFETPKPVVWGDSFKPESGEENMKALRRCYPQLLKDRVVKYNALADVTIPGTLSRKEGITALEIVEALRAQL